MTATVSPLFQAVLQLFVLLHAPQGKDPHQGFFPPGQGVILPGGPPEVDKAVVGHQRVNIPGVPGYQFFASSSTGVLIEDKSVIAFRSLLYSPENSILPGTISGSMTP